jgi:hypothetical protein
MQVSCTCPNGALGTTTCLADGSGYNACTNCSMMNCTAGQTVPCTCDNGTQGTASCLPDGSGYGVCGGCATTMNWYCSETTDMTGTTCLCSDDSQVGNMTTCSASPCCFSGTVSSGSMSYRDCDCYSSWAMNCDGYINSLTMNHGYSSVQRVNSCPQ